MYQHDLPVKDLDTALDHATIDAVAIVGAQLNTASAHLIAKVPGLNAKLAESVLKARPFTSRSHLQVQ